MTYTISGVSQNVKDVNGKYGPTKVYKIKVEGIEEAIDYMVDASKPAPSVGEILQGTIAHNDYGAYFKKDKMPRSFGNSSPRPPQNNFTMYVSYVKDILIAYMQANSWDVTKYNALEFDTFIEEVGRTAQRLREYEISSPEKGEPKEDF